MKRCPICFEKGGFHFDEIHALRPVSPPEKSLALQEDDGPFCRACGRTINGPGAEGCRYPNHKEAS